jgi:uracil-DNA glycosylase
MLSRPLTEVVEAGWAQALEPVADRIAAMGDFPRAEVAAGRTYLLADLQVQLRWALDGSTWSEGEVSSPVK